MKSIIKKTYVLCFLVIFGISSCNEDFLEKEPVDLMNPEQVFNSPEAVQAYFVSLYKDLPIEDFGYVNGVFGDFPGAGNQYTANWTWESLASSSYSGTNHAAVWAKMYRAIRNVNTFLISIEDVKIASEVKSAYVAEAKFVRAYYYFGLVKYFGGVPILLEPQQFNGDTESLLVARNKEVEVWDLIRSDLSAAAAGLPKDSPYGRANKYVALALMSRTMLYAGSISKFGKVQLDGLVGIPAEKAAGYYQASYDASNEIINSQKYQLFKKYSDKAKNFQYLFYELQGNPEAIFCKGYNYDATLRTHSQDLMALPYVLRAPQGYANRLCPGLKMVEMFDKVDGSSGKFNTGTAGNYVHFKSPQDLFIGKDPRFFGSVISTHSMFKETLVTSQRGVIYNGKEYQGSNYNQYFDIPSLKIVTAPTSNSVVATGNSKFDESVFWLKKWTDPERPSSLLGDWKSDTDWLDMRYSEVLLNQAEAAFEANISGSNDALTLVNQVRERAGIALLGSVDRDKIRHERAVELAWENRTFWDLKRWRTLTTEFSLWIPEGLFLFYDINAKDYIFRRTTAGSSKTYQDKHYYDQIPGDARAKNPLLVNNPGY